MNCDIFIPVRLKSARLPKKALKKIDGRPVILLLIDRLLLAKKIRNIIVCTTADESDDELVKTLENENIIVFRGSEKDILVRFLDAARKHHTEFIVSVDGDDIYSDPNFVDRIVIEFEKTNADYIQVSGVPIGFTPFGIKTTALQRVCQIKRTDNTETGYTRFFTDTKIFNIKNVIFKSKIGFPINLRLSLDYEEDFNLSKEIFKALGNDFHIEDVLRLLNEKPELLEITKLLTDRWEKHWNTNLADLSVTDNTVGVKKS